MIPAMRLSYDPNCALAGQHVYAPDLSGGYC